MNAKTSTLFVADTSALPPLSAGEVYATERGQIVRRTASLDGIRAALARGDLPAASLIEGQPVTRIECPDLGSPESFSIKAGG